MGRDRDPFERTLAALRRRLAERGPLQGAPLPVAGLAAELGVSPTPVREALARLSGEELVARSGAGYAGLVHDRESLAGLYALAGLLATAAIVGTKDGDLVASPDAGLLEQLARSTTNPAIAVSLRRVAAQLAPFAVAEADLFGEQVPVLSVGELRRHYRRRMRRASEILRQALGF